MILLDRNSYDLVKESLMSIRINNLFARAVVEKHVTGLVYVDDTERPQAFYIVHPYGISLLFGEAGNGDFNLQLLDYLFNTHKRRNKVEWLQAYPGEWNTLLSALLGDRLVASGANQGDIETGIIEENTRVNFRFNKEIYLNLKGSLSSCEYQIVCTDRELFEKMQGSVVPQYFWDCAEDFCKNGTGFSLVIGNRPVSTAYSAYIIEDYLELGIETVSEYRGKGLALFTCSALIDYCLENDYEPVWSCRLENTGSYKLAQKLGFQPALTLPYYRLPV